MSRMVHVARKPLPRPWTRFAPALASLPEGLPLRAPRWGLVEVLVEQSPERRTQRACGIERESLASTTGPAQLATGVCQRQYGAIKDADSGPAFADVLQGRHPVGFDPQPPAPAAGIGVLRQGLDLREAAVTCIEEQQHVELHGHGSWGREAMEPRCPASSQNLGHRCKALCAVV